MPDCPNCKVIIGLSEIGPICPECRKLFGPLELHDLPDYNFFRCTRVMGIFIELMEMSLIDNQIYYIGTENGHVAVLPLGITHN